MAADTGTTSQKVPAGRVLPKKEANRIAAAKTYIAAMEQAGQEVPGWVRELAGMADETDDTSRKAPTSRVVAKKAANRAAAAKVYIAAMKEAGEELLGWVKKLAKQVT